jgi:hypothetical protein
MAGYNRDMCRNSLDTSIEMLASYLTKLYVMLKFGLFEKQPKETLRLFPYRT